MHLQVPNLQVVSTRFMIFEKMKISQNFVAGLCPKLIAITSLKISSAIHLPFLGFYFVSVMKLPLMNVSCDSH